MAGRGVRNQKGQGIGHVHPHEQGGSSEITPISSPQCYCQTTPIASTQGNSQTTPIPSFMWRGQRWVNLSALEAVTRKL
ncbi:unnamed protein product [Ilex paraguariensis]|uniref:Uncharacterized protein n=1 Tax=Ilex paraguariensis TaxID=185542 RepID=A0ABC8SZX2_9AQUA